MVNCLLRISSLHLATDKALACHPPSRKATEGKELTKNNPEIDPSPPGGEGKEGKLEWANISRIFFPLFELLILKKIPKRGAQVR